MALIGTIAINVRANTRRFTKQIAGVRKQLNGMARAASRATETLGRIGAVAATAGFVAAAREAEQFNRAMNRSTAIMEVTIDQMNRMRAAAKEVARQTRFSTDQVAEGFFFLASAGLDAEQSIAALPQVAAFAQAGNFDLALATDLATDAQSALGLTVKDTAKNLKNLERVTDVLIGANTLANASAEQFSLALTTKVGTAARTLGIEIEDVTAVLAGLADQGVKSETAGTQLSSVLITLATNAAQNKAAFDRLGLRVFDVQGNFRSLTEIVTDLERVFGDMTDEQRAAELATIGFGKRIQGFVNPLIGISDKVQKFRADLEDMGGKTQEVADKQLTDLEKATAKVQVAFTELGEAIAPITDTLISGLSRAAEEMAVVVGTFSDSVDLIVARVELLLVKGQRFIAGFLNALQMGFEEFKTRAIESFTEVGKAASILPAAVQAAVEAAVPGGESPLEAFTRVMAEGVSETAMKAGTSIGVAVSQGFMEGTALFDDEVAALEMEIEALDKSIATTALEIRKRFEESRKGPEALEDAAENTRSFLDTLLPGFDQLTKRIVQFVGIQRLAQDEAQALAQELSGVGFAGAGVGQAVGVAADILASGVLQGAQMAGEALRDPGGAAAALRGTQEAFSAIARFERQPADQKIAENTEKTAENTARTATAVEALDQISRESIAQVVSF